MDENKNVEDRNPDLFSSPNQLSALSSVQFFVGSMYSQLLWFPTELFQITAGLRWDYSTRFGHTFNPRLAIVSAGENNPFGHPSDEVMGRLTEKLEPENLYRTDEHGTIEFITDGERLWVKMNK